MHSHPGCPQIPHVFAGASDAGRSRSAGFGLVQWSFNLPLQRGLCRGVRSLGGDRLPRLLRPALAEAALRLTPVIPGWLCCEMALSIIIHCYLSYLPLPVVTCQRYPLLSMADDPCGGQPCRGAQVHVRRALSLAQESPAKHRTSWAGGALPRSLAPVSLQELPVPPFHGWTADGGWPGSIVPARRTSTRPPMCVHLLAGRTGGDPWAPGRCARSRVRPWPPGPCRK